MKKVFDIGFWRYLFLCLKSEKLIEKNKFKEAVSRIESHLKAKHYTTEAIYYLLGKAHFGARDYNLAIKSFLLSIENNRFDDIYKANAYAYLGNTFYENGEYDKAVLNFKKSINIKEGLRINKNLVYSIPDVYCCLGRAYAKLKNNSEAFEAFNAGLKLEPNHEALQRELSLLGLG